MNAIDLIAAERARHPGLGFDAEHDAGEDHKNGELAMAACYYAIPETTVLDFGTVVFTILPDLFFPDYWDFCWKKRDSKDRIRQLVVAGALIAAEIDRLLAEHSKPGIAGTFAELREKFGDKIGLGDNVDPVEYQRHMRRGEEE